MIEVIRHRKVGTIIIDSLSAASEIIYAGAKTSRMTSKGHIEEVEPRQRNYQIIAYEQAMQAVWDKKYPYKAIASMGVRPEIILGNHASIPFGPPWAHKRKFWFQTWTERDVFCKEWDGTPL